MVYGVLQNKLLMFSFESSVPTFFWQNSDETGKLVERLDKASTANGKEISAEKNKLMTKNTSGINTEIKVNGQKLETITSFKYMGPVVTDEGPKPEILSGIAQQQQH